MWILTIIGFLLGFIILEMVGDYLGGIVPKKSKEHLKHPSLK